MVIANCDSATDCTFEIRPNRSLTRRGMLVFFLLVSVAVFLLGIRFALLGAWLVMPFTILEVVVLGTALYQFERATAYREVISLGQDGLLVRREARGGMTEWVFQPYWAQVVLAMDPGSWYPSKLYIRSHGRQVEIGSCLTECEREKLSGDLKTSITRYLRTAA